MFRTISAATVVCLMGTVSFAGALETDFEKEPERKPVFVPAGSGIGAPAVIGALVAAAAVAAIASNGGNGDGDNNTTTTTTGSAGNTVTD